MGCMLLGSDGSLGFRARISLQQRFALRGQIEYMNLFFGDLAFLVRRNHLGLGNVVLIFCELQRLFQHLERFIGGQHGTLA